MENSLIRQLHHSALKEKSNDEKISRKTKYEIEELLQEAEGGASPECRRDELLLAAAAAEENGFIMGFIYAFRLFSECAGE